MGTVCETEIYQAFAQMYYKLMDNRHFILNPMLMQLEELKEKSLCSRPEVMDLNRKISELAKQNHSLARLQAKGCMDSAVFIERSNRNNRKIEKLRLQLVKLQGSDHISETIENTQLLVKLMDQEKSMLEFDPSIFKMMIRQIIAALPFARQAFITMGSISGVKPTATEMQIKRQKSSRLL